MKLNELLENVEVLNILGDTEVEITGVNIDSRKIEKGHLFIAIPGTQTDGHKFIPKAIEQGAVAVLCEYFPNKREPGVTYIAVESTEDNVGMVATQFYGNPSSQLKLVGVTGTNGKTTIATLLYNMFRKLGHKCGLLSTVCNYIEGECSSHAIAQKRIGGLRFTGGIFTNLTRDHLDYHGTFENYRDAKKAFFDGLDKDAFAITNADDKNGAVMVQNCKAQIKTYSTRTMADFKAKIIECHFEGMYLDINGKEVGVQFIGKFNVSNLLAVYGAAVMLGKKPEDILIVLSTLKSVSGRLEPIHSPEGYTAIVDYAHTPDALENVLNAIHEVLDGKGKVITVCGAGGNRDKGKRPLMAQEAVKQSDKVIITSDNPRFEEPQDIINDMLAGLDNKQMKKVISIVDRREAIRTACMMAEKGDVILIAGKGHEDYQEIQGVKHHFDDKEVVREIFNA